ncbi:MAG TPA: DNA replication/repair protein RecF [Steroidobacteraceae bacterium]|nr:DNA replication/repair protein RecF [Steroidobacteraceae bacterium]
MLTAIDIENFRCIRSARLELDRQATGIVGENGSGKTSLLESIYFLAHGRSFRTNQREKLLPPQAPFLRVVGQIETGRGVLVAGLEYGAEGTKAHLAGQGVSGIAEIAEILPVQVIDPGVHRLIEEGSARRRRLLDWGVFHVKHEFLGVWRRYQRALQQRNAVLRQGADEQLLVAWERELSSAGHRVDELRAEYAALLLPHFVSVADQLLGAQGARFTYRRGWAADADLAMQLAESRPRDQRLRTTTVGAHRADVAFFFEGAAARDRVSRGQQKLLAAAFILGQLTYQSALGAPPACLMIDDPAAELDVDNLGKLLAAVSRIPAQLIITSVHESGLEGLKFGRKFHVKQGNFL